MPQIKKSRVRLGMAFGVILTLRSQGYSGYKLMTETHKVLDEVCGFSPAEIEFHVSKVNETYTEVGSK